jgi:hypothetical protein
MGSRRLAAVALLALPTTAQGTIVFVKLVGHRPRQIGPKEISF